MLDKEIGMQHQFSRSLIGQEDTILAQIKAVSEQEKHTRFSVYRNNVFSSLIDALADIYPVCKTLVGEEFFNALAYHYIQHSPPSSPILSEYGNDFAHFARQLPQLAELPYFEELAQLEYQLLQLTHQADEPILSAEAIQHRMMGFADPIETRWIFSKHCLLCRTTYAVGSIYTAHQPDSAFTLADIEWQKPEYLLLTKNNHYGHCYTISEQEWQLLFRLQQGDTFSQACHHLDQQSLTQLFVALMQKPIIRDIWQI
jgi:hypothetical protein